MGQRLKVDSKIGSRVEITSTNSPSPLPRWVSCAVVAVASANVLGCIALAVVLGRGGNLTVDMAGFTGPYSRAAAMLAAFDGVCCPVAGAFLASRRPRHPVGWLLLLIGAGLLLANAATTIAEAGYNGKTIHPLLLEKVALVATGPLEVTAVMVPLLIAVFPSGVVAPGWRRWALAGGAVAGVIDAIALMLRPKLQAGSEWFSNPIGIPALRGATAVAVPAATIALVILAFGVAGDLIVRWHRSTGIVRQQMRYFGEAVVVVLLCLFSIPLLRALGAPVSLAWDLWFAVALDAFAVATGLAVARFRLYEIDRVVSRTLGYAILTGLVVGVYAGTVALVTKVMGFSSPIAVAASTLAAVAVFNPARKRVQRAVDRRFNRVRYDAAATVAAFTVRLRDAVDLDTIQSDLANVLREAFEPAHISVWIRERRPV